MHYLLRNVDGENNAHDCVVQLKIVNKIDTKMLLPQIKLSRVLTVHVHDVLRIIDKRYSMWHRTIAIEKCVVQDIYNIL